MSEPKIVITGTGRCGTTLLVQLLTRLGLDTGFDVNASIDQRARAGLELWIGDPDAPRIVKDPTLCHRLKPLLEEGSVKVEHVLIPIRDGDVAAASRVRASSYGLRPKAKGALLNVVRPSRQKEALYKSLYSLMYTVAHFDLPTTFLEFPRFANDWEYTYKKLQFLIPDHSPEQFQEAFNACVKRDLIHETPLTARERTLSSLGEPLSLFRRAKTLVFERFGQKPAPVR